MQVDFDVTEFIDFADTLQRVARTIPKKSKQFLRREGDKLVRRTKARAKTEVGTKHKKPAKYANSKHYVDTIHGSKIFMRWDGSMGISCCSAAPHAHLIEYGYEQFSHGKPIGRFEPGKLIFQKEFFAFRDPFIDDTEAFLDEALGEIE